MGGRRANHGVAASARHLGGRRRVALVDHFAAAGAAECPGVHITAIAGNSTVPILNTISAWKGRHTDRNTHERRPSDADANSTTHGNADGNAATLGDTDPRANAIVTANAKPDSDSNANTGSDSNTNAGSNTNPDACAANVQPCVRHRDGKRGIKQPDW